MSSPVFSSGAAFVTLAIPVENGTSCVESHLLAPGLFFFLKTINKNNLFSENFHATQNPNIRFSLFL